MPNAVTAKRPRFVSYLRVSTDKQGSSGLGIAAQRQAVQTHLQQVNHGAELLEEFVEVESGKRKDRPQLAKALERCELAGATLIIARLDRLSRNAHFLLSLKEAGVSFVACDNPYADGFTVGILALVAQKEAEAISERTKAALKAAKARGKKLGNPWGEVRRRTGYGPDGLPLYERVRGNVPAVAKVKAKADEKAGKLKAQIAAIRSEGHTSLAAIARELTKRGILTSRKSATWHPATVQRLLERIDG